MTVQAPSLVLRLRYQVIDKLRQLLQPLLIFSCRLCLRVCPFLEVESGLAIQLLDRQLLALQGRTLSSINVCLGFDAAQEAGLRRLLTAL